MKRLEAALKAFGPGFHVYQYLFKSNRPDIPFANMTTRLWQRQSSNAASSLKRSATTFIRSRSFTAFCSKARVENRSGRGARQLFRDPAGAIGELKAQFTSDNMKTLLRARSSAMLPALTSACRHSLGSSRTSCKSRS